MTSLYDILKANRLGMDSDPWIAILGEAWKASEEVFKEYTGLVPYTFIANGQPLLDWYIKGNMVQNGTPSPQNPVMPNGVGNKTTNLFDYKSASYGTWTNSNGSTIQAGYAARSANVNAETITISCNGETKPYSYSVIWLDINDEFISRDHIGSASAILIPQTFTPPNNAVNFYIQVANGTDTTIPITESQLAGYKIMLNTGSTALPYDPSGYKIPISSANTTTPVYLGEVETTRRIKKQVFDGTESWSLYDSSGNRFFYMSIADSITRESSLPCTHGFTVMSVTSPGTYIIRIYDNNSLYPTKDDFTDYLAAQYAAGTPVTVWCVLATETTGIVNEPLMKIGDYADTLIAAQAGVEIPTDRGRNTIDIDTDIKPSEFYMKWKER